MSFDCVIACNHRTGSAGTLAHGDVAQLGEHGLCKPGVGGSSPLVSTLCPCCSELLPLAIRLRFGQRRWLEVSCVRVRVGGAIISPNSCSPGDCRCWHRSLESPLRRLREPTGVGPAFAFSVSLSCLERQSGSVFFLYFRKKVFSVSFWQEVVVDDRLLFDNLVVASRWHLRSNGMITLGRLVFLRPSDVEC